MQKRSGSQNNTKTSNDVKHWGNAIFSANEIIWRWIGFFAYSAGAIIHILVCISNNLFPGKKYLQE